VDAADDLEVDKDDIPDIDSKFPPEETPLPPLSRNSLLAIDSKGFATLVPTMMDKEQSLH